MTFTAGSSALLVGVAVEHAELEAASVVVVSIGATWALVRVPASGQLVKVSLKNLKAVGIGAGTEGSVAAAPGEFELINSGHLPSGVPVVVHGLRQSPETNGQQALIEHWLPGEERYAVSFGRDVKDKNKGALLRPGNLRLPREKDNRQLVGRFVKRPLSNDRFLVGKVTRYHAGLGLFVRYEDGDREHMSAIDVLKLAFIPDDREHARLAGILAKWPESPSDDEAEGSKLLDEPPSKVSRISKAEAVEMLGMKVYSDPAFYSHRGGGQDKDGLWLRSIREALVTIGVIEEEKIVDENRGEGADESATLAEIIATEVHSREYIEGLAKVATLITPECPRIDLGKKVVVGLLGRALAICDGECIMDKFTMKAVLLRAGMTRKALFSVLRGEVECGFILARPACHHVPYIVREDDDENDEDEKVGTKNNPEGQTSSGRPSDLTPGDEVACGFCFVNSVAFSIREAQKKFSRPGIPLKLAILDVDVHHGNGNEHVFNQDPNILHISLHRYGDTADGHRIMPASGHFEDCGEGEGRGFNINFEMHADDGDAEYCDVLGQVVFPMLHEFQADAVILLCGFDALDHSAASDKFRGPGMDCSLTPRWFWWLGQQMRQRCPRMLVSTEGGYDPVQAGLAGECLVRGLRGEGQPAYYHEIVDRAPKDDIWLKHVSERITFFRTLGWKL